MLQQTQVVTVKSYFARFIERFANVAALAQASEDDVLGLWSGLGYYSRARNLHRCAQQVVAQFGGAFPRDAATLATLPGIGRSTASAIASLCFDERVAILDANAKRVVARVRAFDADLALSSHEKQLWQAATDLLPAPHRQADMATYTQAMMDLGASVCSAKKPACAQCPVQDLCLAHAAGAPERYPVRSRKLKRSSQSLWLLWLQRADGAVWLSKRPAPGVWAGLHCLPLFGDEAALCAALPPAAQAKLERLPLFTHVLTHKDLHLHPLRLHWPSTAGAWPQGAEVGGAWVDAQAWPALGLPAPIRKLLQAP